MVQNFLVNWKTSAAGFATLLIALLSTLGIHVPGVTIDPGVSGSLWIIGFGLLFGKDNNVTGGTVTNGTVNPKAEPK